MMSCLCIEQRDVDFSIEKDAVYTANCVTGSHLTYLLNSGVYILVCILVHIFFKLYFHIYYFV